MGGAGPIPVEKKSIRKPVGEASKMSENAGCRRLVDVPPTSVAKFPAERIMTDQAQPEKNALTPPAPPA
ncbi:MAG: hypothetical protein D6725_12620, partial [Planctomycetota bacterium]